MLIALEGKSVRSFSKEIAISHSYLTQILNGKKNPSPTVASKISEGLNKKIDDVFTICLVDDLPNREDTE